MIETMNPTIEQACDALAPKDELDERLRYGEDLKKEEVDLLLARRHACTTAALKVVRFAAQALDADREDKPHTAEAEKLLGEVVAWQEKPSEAAAKRVAKALDASDLVTRAPKPALGAAPGTPVAFQLRPTNAFRSRFTKAVYHTIRTVLSELPSDAAADLRAVAGAAAQAIELAANQPGGWSHARLIGMIQAEGV